MGWWDAGLGGMGLGGLTPTDGAGTAAQLRRRVHRSSLDHVESKGNRVNPRPATLSPLRFHLL